MTDPDVFSADIGKYFGPTTETPVALMRDVIISTTGDADADVNEFREHPPVGSPLLRRMEGRADPVDLGRGVRLDRLADDEAELVMNACTPSGHHFVPIRQFGQRFSFIRELDVSEWDRHPYAWDRDGVMTDALMLSRLVRDNSYSTEYAARIVYLHDGKQVVAYTLGAELDHVYRARRARSWLDYNEAAELRELLAVYWSMRDIPPASRALWRTEYASWIKWADVTRSYGRRDHDPREGTAAPLSERLARPERRGRVHPIGGARRTRCRVRHTSRCRHRW